MSSEVLTINRLMKRGYKFQESGNMDECLSIWLDTWKAVDKFIISKHIESIGKFDKSYKLQEVLSNWIMDFQEVLRNARQYELFLEFSQWLIPLMDKNDQNLCVIKMDMAEVLFDMGDEKVGESEFERLTADYPEYAWGWINWSRRYWFYSDSHNNYKKGEEILLKALEVKNMEDRSAVYEVLQEIYEATGRSDKVKTIKKEMKMSSIDNQMNSPYLIPDWDEEQESVVSSSLKIGRNEPCPCGSGKKYKKCCLA